MILVIYVTKKDPEKGIFYVQPVRRMPGPLQ